MVLEYFLVEQQNLYRNLQAAKKALKLARSIEKLDKYDCLILDDFGYVQKDDLKQASFSS